MTNQYEFEGKTVDDAIADGLIKLGLSRSQVDIEILQKGNRGIFGIGSEPALVRLVPHAVTMAQDSQHTKPAAEAPPDTTAEDAAEAEDASASLPSHGDQARDTTPSPTTETSSVDVSSDTAFGSPPGESSSADREVSHAEDSNAKTESEENARSAVWQDENIATQEHHAQDAATQEGVGKPGLAETSETASYGTESPERVESAPEADAEAGTPAENEADDYVDYEISRSELTAVATELLDTMIRLMGFTVTIHTEWQEPEDEDEEACLLLNIEGEDLGPLIGRNGETLSNIQYLLRLMINQRIREWRNIVVDIAGYKARRTEKITQLALRMAQQVSNTGRAIALEPMPSNERRVIHMALRDHPDVYTQSTGESERRKVNIFPKHN